ncbi:hypothetical protein NK8_58110 (plasmid) [Caballeronia sp. NK8]|uniref:hypothetical protein n=1 Tax=Caballeronia sp. NK8 TaxID=140098 RepID=UPI001BB6C028|nr:hypothetical protein [Caballeronia sp. NK8]BCQ27622.1 hypothetical protein NK8_58110 [Caballeronia sp. NK8]
MKQTHLPGVAHEKCFGEMVRASLDDPRPKGIAASGTQFLTVFLWPPSSWSNDGKEERRCLRNALIEIVCILGASAGGKAAARSNESVINIEFQSSDVWTVRALANIAVESCRNRIDAATNGS